MMDRCGQPFNIRKPLVRLPSKGEKENQSPPLERGAGSKLKRTLLRSKGTRRWEMRKRSRSKRKGERE